MAGLSEQCRNRFRHENALIACYEWCYCHEQKCAGNCRGTSDDYLSVEIMLIIMQNYADGALP